MSGALLKNYLRNIIFVYEHKTNSGFGAPEKCMARNIDKKSGMNTFVSTRQNIWAMRASTFAIVFLCLYSILNHTAAQGDGPPTKVRGVIEGLSPEEREYILSLNHPERRVFIIEHLIHQENSGVIPEFYGRQRQSGFRYYSTNQY